MSVWGIGGKWLLWSLLLATPIIFVAWLFGSALVVDMVPDRVYYMIGTLTLLVGVPFWLISAVTLKRNFDSEQLCSTGVFGLCRNPIYAAWILFLVPGVLLFFRMPVLLLIPFVMYAVLRAYLPQEEIWLEGKFGTDYLDYRRQVPRLVPFSNVLARRQRG